MTQKLIVIKLGGAVITYKDNLTPKVRISTIKRLAKELKQLIDKNYQLILVHGAGSFGHGLVKKYDLQHGMKTDQQKLAFGMVINSMLKLNSIVIQALHEENIQAVSIPPHAFTNQSASKLNYLETGMIKRYLENRQIPVLFGDMVLDDKWGCSVLSGDTITCYLASELKADQVIFLSDVDGVFDTNPKTNPKAKLIPEINNSNIKQVLKGLSATGRVDVTGEMSGKILEIKKSLKRLPVWLINGRKPRALIDLMNGDPIGTKLLLH